MMVPTRRQAIIWTIDGQIIYAYILHLASMSYNCGLSLAVSIISNQYLLKIFIDIFILLKYCFGKLITKFICHAHIV